MPEADHRKVVGLWFLRVDRHPSSPLVLNDLMALCDNQNDTAVIGEHAVYPGHPVTLALVIVRIHPNFTFANTDGGHGWAHAVGCSAVPGAGGNVHDAMHFLREWVRGEAIDKLFEEADRVWHDCDGQAEGGGSYAKDDAQRQRFIDRWSDGQAEGGGSYAKDDAQRQRFIDRWSEGQAEGGGSYAKDDAQRQRFIDRWSEGQAQADRFKPLLIEALKTWPRA